MLPSAALNDKINSSRNGIHVKVLKYFGCLIFDVFWERSCPGKMRHYYPQKQSEKTSKNNWIKGNPKNVATATGKIERGTKRTMYGKKINLKKMCEISLKCMFCKQHSFELYVGFFLNASGGVCSADNHRPKGNWEGKSYGSKKKGQKGGKPMTL